MNRKDWKCNGTKWCNSMSQMLGLANSEARGLSTVVVIDMATGKQECVGVRCRGKARDPGVMLNVCPFCEAGVCTCWKGPRIDKSVDPDGGGLARD